MYNEEKNAYKCCIKIVSEIKKLTPYKLHLILVNDGSTDNTQLVLLKAKKKFKNTVSLVSYTKNKGYGKALQEGVKKAESEKCTYVIFMDSDLTNDPVDIKKFLQTLTQKPGCVKGSRYMKGGKTIGVPFKRKAISIAGNTVAAFLFKTSVKDCTNGYRMVKIDLIKHTKFKENGFAIILEEFYYLQKKGAKILEVPVTLTSRVASASHFRYNIKTFYSYIKYPAMSFLSK